jgi:hypothetical protein
LIPHSSPYQLNPGHCGQDTIGELHHPVLGLNDVLAFVRSLAAHGQVGNKMPQ